jgi:hypothetical protein
MDTTEYLEQLFSESFKRELDRDENAVRSIPLFGATLGLAASLFSYATPRMPPFSGSPYSLFLWAILLIGAGCLGVGVVWLVIAIRARHFVFPPKETDLLVFTRELKAHHRRSGRSPGKADALALAELREKMMEEFARTAVHNRENNFRRLRARTVGITLAAISLIMALAMVAATFVKAQTDGVQSGGGPAAASAPKATAPNSAHP